MSRRKPGAEHEIDDDGTNDDQLLLISDSVETSSRYGTTSLHSSSLAWLENSDHEKYGSSRVYRREFKRQSSHFEGHDTNK